MIGANEKFASALISPNFPLLHDWCSQHKIQFEDNKDLIQKKEVIEKSYEKPVLVDFWAAWCGPCRMLGPIIEELSNDFEGKAVVGKVDVDANQEFAAKYGVRNIPTVLVFDKGELVGRQVGISTKNVYSEAIESLL